MSRTLEILSDLVAFPSVTGASNVEIAGYAEALLRAAGAACIRLPSEDGRKCGLLARIGPPDDGGVMLSAHMDVVPVTGQDWTRPAFRLTRDGDRLFGRGTTDMKGFLAAALAAAERAGAAPLRRPLLLCLSYDEEIGCRGISEMAVGIVPALGQPSLCIVGEPTSMRIATGHKGKITLHVLCRGAAGHSASAPNYLNALHLAADVIALVRSEQDLLRRTGAQDPDYEVPFSTLHVGRLSGGTSLNIVPDRAEIELELRHLAGDDPGAILARLQAGAARIAADAGHPAAEITLSERGAYPGLDTDHAAAAAVAGLLPPGTGRIKVAFGTEAGVIAGLGIPSVVCGPGSMAQGHQPDEYIEAGELDRADAMLDRLIDRLGQPG